MILPLEMWLLTTTAEAFLLCLLLHKGTFNACDELHKLSTGRNESHIVQYFFVQASIRPFKDYPKVLLRYFSHQSQHRVLK